MSTRTAFYATMVIFAVNGMAFASWAARIPAAARVLGLSNGELGGILFVSAIGSLISLPLSGPIASRFGTAATIRLGGTVAGVGALVLSLAMLLASVPLTALGLLFFGLGIGLWDVSQNIEGAAVEVKLGRTVMPRFHAAFSGGAFIGALAGAGLSGLGVSVAAHLAGMAVLVLVSIWWCAAYFLPASAHQEVAGPVPPGKQRSAWRETRTLMVGLVVLGAALTEGAANDWVAKGTVEGLHQPEWVGALVFATFIFAMTVFRFFGGAFLDKYGRIPVLFGCLVSALIGLAIFVFSPNVWLAAVGALFWGAGAALGFPTGMSAAADDPRRAAKRVSVVSTIGYVAFLAGPPGIGFLAQAFSIRPALLTVGIIILLSIVVIPAARKLPPESATEPAAQPHPAQPQPGDDVER